METILFGTADKMNDTRLEHHDFFLLWNDEEKDWASHMYTYKEFVAVFERYVEIHRLLKDAPVGEQRSRLVDEAFKLRE